MTLPIGAGRSGELLVRVLDHAVAAPAGDPRAVLRADAIEAALRAAVAPHPRAAAGLARPAVVEGTDQPLARATARAADADLQHVGGAVAAAVPYAAALGGCGGWRIGRGGGSEDGADGQRGQRRGEAKSHGVQPSPPWDVQLAGSTTVRRCAGTAQESRSSARSPVSHARHPRP